MTETFFLFWWWMVGGGWMATFWFFKSLDINMVYTLGVCIYLAIVIISAKILVGLILSSSWTFFNYFQNHPARMIFSKMVFNFTVLEGIFDTKFHGWFFLFRIIFKGISFVNGRWVQFFGELFFLVRFIFKGVWHKFRQRILGLQFRFWCWTRLSMLKKVFHFSDIANRVKYQK